eukprot:764976-Hanusia_phi.AAC.2
MAGTTEVVGGGMLAELLASVPVVAEACMQDMAAVEELAGECVLEEVDEDRVVVAEGSRVRGLYVLTLGSVSLSSREQGRGCKVLKVVRAAAGSSSPPRILCLWPALTGDRCSMSLAAMAGGATLLCVPRKALLETVRRVRSQERLVECVVSSLKGDHGDKVVRKVREKLEHVLLEETANESETAAAAEEKEEVVVDLWQVPEEGKDCHGRQLVLQNQVERMREWCAE